MKNPTILFVLLIVTIEAFAGLVEPCTKWEYLPVKVCRGTPLLRYQYQSKLESEEEKNFNEDLKRLPGLSLVDSNKFYPKSDGLWNLAKQTISLEFSKDKTGLFYEFIESDDISKCDSVLFLANENIHVSSIGDRSDFRKNKNKISTNKDQKVPSITIVSGNDGTENILGDEDSIKLKFESKFRAYLSHEFGHLSGLRHTHAYRPLEYGKEEKGKTAVDVCGLDQESIMDYGVLHHSNDISDILQKLISQEDTGPQRFITPGSCLNNHDKKILRCLYNTGTIDDACPDVQCKEK
ncbi:MAG: hypothetical protein ACOVP4_02940 [Bacteriovoracaceae bacterium]